MTSRDQLARQWAKYYSENWPEVRSTASPRSFFEGAKAAVEFILDHTTPEPETMADVDWDDEKHYLAGCMSPYGSMVMLRPQGANMIVHDLNSDLTEVFDRDDLTPNGKRYELREVGAGEPDVRRARALVEELARDHNLHSLTDGKLARTMNEVLDALATPTPVEEAKRPATLETLQDHYDAPEGTIVAAAHGAPWVKEVGEWWVGNKHATSESIAYQPRTVLRWGWGK